MHMVAYVFRRVPGMSLEAFKDYYENVHGPKMVEVLEGKGLVSYDHYPTRPQGLGDETVPADGPLYDAMSIYVFDTAESAAAAWSIPEIVEDSQKFIDSDSVVTLPLIHRRVYPQ